MGRQRKSTHTDRVATREATTTWSSLTWDDLDLWAGSRSVSRGRAYQRQGRVKDLVRAEDGRLLASVIGSDRYTTAVWLTQGKGRSHRIESKCTCPLGVACKHAVAVVTAILDAMAHGNQVPVADPDDPRWKRLSGTDAGLDEFGDDLDEEEDNFDDEFETPEHDRPARKTSKSSRGGDEKPRTRAQWDEMIQSHIQTKSQVELARLVWSFVERFPELREEFQERIALAKGDVGRLVNQARRELYAVTGEIGWRNRWSNEGHTPNYSRLKHKLERLNELGHHDEVVDLADELIQRGMDQVEQSDDEGETSMELVDCLAVVFNALVKSKRPAADKILQAIEAELHDDYGIVGETTAVVLGAEWQPGDWSIVADRLAERLRKMPAGRGGDDFTRNYQRDNVSGWLGRALERAGRDDELLALYETEARVTHSYERLVKYVLKQGRLEDAERWAREGIEKTQEKWPGIASSLLKTLCELARRRKRWDIVAAHAARDFFERPSVAGLQELVAAADRAKCGEPVRAAAVAFLESGQPPVRWSVSDKGKPRGAVDSAWPLPTPDYLTPPLGSDRIPRGTPRPHYDVLLEMAIAGKRPDDVLRWYEKMGAAARGSAHGWGEWAAHGYPHYSDRVAVAVVSAYPDRALEIYRRGLDSNLKQPNTSAYEACAGYLRKMRPILKSLGRETEWTKLLTDIRTNYRNRPRFMEILDKLEGRTILQTQKAGRRR